MGNSGCSRVSSVSPLALMGTIVFVGSHAKGVFFCVGPTHQWVGVSVALSAKGQLALRLRRSHVRGARLLCAATKGRGRHSRGSPKERSISRARSWCVGYSVRGGEPACASARASGVLTKGSALQRLEIWGQERRWFSIKSVPAEHVARRVCRSRLQRGKGTNPL